MEPMTREQLELLVDLQAKETEASRIRAELDRLPGQMALLEKGLAAFEEAIETRRAAVKEMRKNYRASEADLEMNEARIRKRKDQLHSVKKNEEYQAILKEIDEIRKANSRIEDAMLKSLDEIDAAEKEVVEQLSRHQAEKVRIDAEKSILNEAADRQRESLDRLVSESQAIAEQIDEKLRKKFYDIRSRTGGVAIVPVNEAVCKGCNLNIPPQMYNELHRGNQLRLCPHCHRIVYVL